MIRKAITFIFLLLCLILLAYLALPNFSFPAPPPDSLISKEPADTETTLRRAYFTNYTREQVLSWYENEMRRSTFLGLTLPTFLLNYPPEEAQTIIRDQTRSTFLQEVVHPMRESVFVNGYEPASTDQKNAIFIEGQHWRQKIIVRFIPSSLLVRIAVFFGVIISIFVISGAWEKTIFDLRKEKIKIW